MPTNEEEAAKLAAIEAVSQEVRAQVALATAAAVRADASLAGVRAAISELKETKAERLQDALKLVPKIGPALAFFVRHMGVSSVALILAFFFIAPLLYPLLFGFYMAALMPEQAQQWYSKQIVENFSLEQNFADEIERAAATLVAANNERLDFSQQFQQVWEKNGEERSPVYSFPIEVGQELTVNFKTLATAANKPCETKSKKAVEAHGALGNKELFAVLIFQKPRLSANAFTSGEFFQLDRSFWESDKQAAAQTAETKRAIVQVVLNGPIAAAALECWSLRSDLQVTVRKSLAEIKVKRISAQASAVAHK